MLQSLPDDPPLPPQASLFLLRQSPHSAYRLHYHSFEQWLGNPTTEVLLTSMSTEPFEIRSSLRCQLWVLVAPL